LVEEVAHQDLQIVGKAALLQASSLAEQLTQVQGEVEEGRIQVEVAQTVAVAAGAEARMIVQQVIQERALKALQEVLVYQEAVVTAQVVVVWDLLDPMRPVQIQEHQVERVLRILLEEVRPLLRVEGVEADMQEDQPLLVAQGLEVRVLWQIRAHEVAMAQQIQDQEAVVLVHSQVVAVQVARVL
jgi:hypothetical protein